MELYVYIFKRLDLKRFEIFKNIPSNCRPQFSDFSQRYRLYYYYFSILRLLILLLFFYITAIFFSKISAILLLFFYITAINITTIFLYYGYIFLRDIGYITTSTNSHIKCIVCICVSFLYICLTSETLHYPWIPSLILLSLYSRYSHCYSRKQMSILSARSVL